MRLDIFLLSTILLVQSAGCSKPPLDTPPLSTPALSIPPLATHPLSIKDFTLQGETVEVLEGGPVVLRLVLTYQGDHTLDMDHPILSAPDACTLAVPKGWERPEPCGIVGGMVGLLGGYIPVRKGDRFVTTVYVHEKFTRIPSGRASLKLSWWVAPYKGRGQEITTTLDFEVPPATPENIAAVRRRIEAAMEQTPLAQDEKRGLARRILETKHRAFVPTALGMLDSGDPAFGQYSLIRFAYAGTDDPKTLHANFVNLVTEKHEGLAGTLFEYWSKERVELPSRELNNLMASSSVWLRAMTYATFGNRCDEARVKATLNELSELQKPLAPEHFARLLADLDNDQFAVREKASRTLENLGERVKVQLRSSLDTSLSVEAKKRVERILEQIENLDSPRFSRVHPGVPALAADTLDYLRYQAPPEGQKVLEAIAQGHSDSPITKLAQTILDKRAKRAVKP